jgi:hypothetical protein
VHRKERRVNFLRRLSIGLIASGLALAIWSSLYLIPFVQPERREIQAGTLHYMFSYENWVHEAGFGRFAISIIALLILFIPYRRGERWAYAALVILAFAYYVPVFLFAAIPNLGTWPTFRHWHMPEPRSINIGLQNWYAFLLTASVVLGLVVSAPIFFWKRGHGNQE